MTVIFGMIIEFSQSNYFLFWFLFSLIVLAEEWFERNNTEFANFSEKLSEGTPRKKNVFRLSYKM